MHREGGPGADRRNMPQDPAQPKHFDRTKSILVNIRILCISFTYRPSKKTFTRSGANRGCLLPATLVCVISFSLPKKKGNPGRDGGEQKQPSSSLGVMAHAGPSDTKLFVKVSSACSSANSSSRQEEFENISATLWFLGPPL